MNLSVDTENDRLRLGVTSELAMIARAAGVPAPGSCAVGRPTHEPSHRPGDPEDHASAAIVSTVIEAAVVDARDALALGATLHAALRRNMIDFLVMVRQRDLSINRAAQLIGAFRAAKVMAQIPVGDSHSGGGR
jgi:hypothetical protein